MTEPRVIHLGPLTDQQAADHLFAAVEVEAAHQRMNAPHEHQAAYVRFSPVPLFGDNAVLATGKPPDWLNGYLCECGQSTPEPPICALCTDGVHHACWNYLAVVPGACPCPCYWDARKGQA